MYGNTPEGIEARQLTTYEALQRHVGGCREWLEEGRCGERAEFVLWGKLYDKEGLGPRCYDHAAQYASHWALEPRSGHALINLRDLAKDIDEAHWPHLQGEPVRGSRDSPRWCDRCQLWGDHHSDRCTRPEPSPDRSPDNYNASGEVRP